MSGDLLNNITFNIPCRKVLRTEFSVSYRFFSNNENFLKLTEIDLSVSNNIVLVSGDMNHNTKIDQKEVKDAGAPQPQPGLVIRKRITFTPEEGAKLERIGLGYFVRKVSGMGDVLEAMREAHLQGVNQIAYKDGKLIMRRRAFKRGAGAVKDGKYQRLEIKVRDIESMITELRRHGFVNGQIKYVKDISQAKDVMTADKEQIEKRRAHGRKVRARKNEQTH